jgi:hypothetical protein
MHVLVPQGIGDSVWCLFKIQDLVNKLKPGPIDIHIACWHVDETEKRALPFLERFSFVNSVAMYVMPRNNNDGPILLPGSPADKNGIYRYIADGPHPELPGIDYVMVPNEPLERAIRLENWLPDIATNWNIMDEFRFTDNELHYANEFRTIHGPFVAFFMASLAGNTVSGHNRNGLWSPAEWIELGDRLHNKYGVQIVVVGTTWDADYFARCIGPHVNQKPHWHNCISEWPIAQTYAVLNKARFLVSYQSGIAIVSHYLGKRVAVFWRPKGDSISRASYVSFEEGMASAWARPDFLSANNLMPCIYGRHKIDDIMQFAEANGW